MIRKVFGRKATTPAAAPAGDIGDERITLKDDDIRRYAMALAARRGYPEDSHDMIGRRVLFLERRELPGLAAFAREVLYHAHEPLESRYKITRPDGRPGGGCPIYLGVALHDDLDELTAAKDPKWFAAPSNPMLLIPKIAEWVRPTGRIAAMFWDVGGKVQAMTTVEGYRIAHGGSFQALHDAERIGIARFPEEEESLPALKSGTRREFSYRAADLSMIQDYIGSGL